MWLLSGLWGRITGAVAVMAAIGGGILLIRRDARQDAINERAVEDAKTQERTQAGYDGARVDPDRITDELRDDSKPF